jgi:hypothetical protein
MEAASRLDVIRLTSTQPAKIMVACLRHPVELHAPVLPASSVPALRYIRQTGSTGFSTRMGTVVPTGKWALSNRLQSKYLMRR